VNISNATISIGAIGAAVLVIGPMVWSSASWAADIEQQVSANAKQIDKLITKIDERDTARSAQHRESTGLNRQLLERIDKLLEVKPQPVTNTQ
jgi:hypothetical protein